MEESLAQPGARLQLTLSPAAAGAAAEPGAAAALRRALAAALGVPHETVLIAGFLNVSTGVLAARFTVDDAVNTEGNAVELADALDGRGGGDGGARRARARARRRRAQASGGAALTSTRVPLELTGLDLRAKPAAPPLSLSALILALAPCAPPCGGAAAGAVGAALAARARAALAPAAARAALAPALAALEEAQGLPPGACDATLNVATVQAVTVARVTVRWSLLAALGGARGAVTALAALAALLLLPPAVVLGALWARRRARARRARVAPEGGDGTPPHAHARGEKMPHVGWAAWADAWEARFFGPLAAGGDHAPPQRRNASAPPLFLPDVPRGDAGAPYTPSGAELWKAASALDGAGEPPPWDAAFTPLRLASALRARPAPAAPSPPAEPSPLPAAAAPTWGEAAGGDGGDGVARRAAAARARSLAAAGIARHKPILSSPLLGGTWSPYAAPAAPPPGARRAHQGLNLGPPAALRRGGGGARAMPLSPPAGSPTLRAAGAHYVAPRTPGLHRSEVATAGERIEESF